VWVWKESDNVLRINWLMGLRRIALVMIPTLTALLCFWHVQMQTVEFPLVVICQGVLWWLVVSQSCSCYHPILVISLSTFKLNQWKNMLNPLWDKPSWTIFCYWWKLSDKSLSSCKHWTDIIVPIRQKCRYNQLSMYQIRKIEIYLSSCKHWTEVSKFYFVAQLHAY